MQRIRRHPVYGITLGAILAATFVVAALSGCSKKDSTSTPTAPTTPTSTSFTGTLVGASVSGALAVSIATGTPAPAGGSAQVTANGSLKLAGGSTIPLSGGYDEGSHALALTGGGYTLAGTYSNHAIAGTFSGPSATSGGFTATEGSSGTVKVYCGTFTSTSGGLSGNFNLVVNGTAISGIAVESDGTEIPLSGTLSGTAISIVNPGNPTGPALATGTLDTTHDTVSGTYNDGAGSSGNWSGGPC